MLSIAAIISRVPVIAIAYVIAITLITGVVAIIAVTIAGVIIASYFYDDRITYRVTYGECQYMPANFGCIEGNLTIRIEVEVSAVFKSIWFYISDISAASTCRHSQERYSRSQGNYGILCPVCSTLYP